MNNLTRPERIMLSVIILLVVAAAAYSAGRFTGPAKVETREVEKIVYRELTVKDLTAFRVVTRDVFKTVRRDVVTTTGPGCQTVTVDKTVEVETSGEVNTSAEVSHSVDAKESERVKVVEKIVTDRPDWHASILVGAGLQAPALPIAGPLVLGVAGERRIVGGLFLGAWIISSPAGGVSVSGEFP